MSEYEGLTDEEVAAERKLLEDVPLLNIGALFLPPIWGPAHGQWWTLIWYPIWAFADTAFYLSVFGDVTPIARLFGVLLFVLLAGFTFLYARLSQPWALHRAIEKRGLTKEQYLSRERIWAIVCVVVGIALLAAATYYNLAIKPTLGA